MNGGHFSADTQDFIAALARHGVRCLLVGGEAVIYHGYPRLTGDVDFWYEQSADNAERLHQALDEFWDGDVPGIRCARELLEPGLVVQFGCPPNRIDLISTIAGVGFDEAWPHRIEETVELDAGPAVPLGVIGLEELLRNKRAAGRHKDLDDVEHLELLTDEL